MSNDVLAILGTARRTSTAGLPIGGGVGFPATKAGEEAWITSHTGGSVNAARARVLLTRYGTRAEDVITYLQAGTDTVFDSTGELSDREVDFMVKHEQVGHLIDVLIRRTSLAFRGLVTGELLAETAAALAGPLGWNEAAVAAEIKHATDVLARFHGVQVQSLVA
jgi:glycerol-3-phosphate dehydrogenase